CVAKLPTVAPASIASAPSSHHDSHGKRPSSGAKIFLPFSSAIASGLSWLCTQKRELGAPWTKAAGVSLSRTHARCGSIPRWPKRERAVPDPMRSALEEASFKAGRASSRDGPAPTTMAGTPCKHPLSEESKTNGPCFQFVHAWENALIP